MGKVRCFRARRTDAVKLGRRGETEGRLPYTRKAHKRRNDASRCTRTPPYRYIRVDTDLLVVPTRTHTHTLTDSLSKHTHTHTHTAHTFGRVCSRTQTSSVYCTIIIVCIIVWKSICGGGGRRVRERPVPRRRQ